MKKVTVTIKRLIQQLYPFYGKIVFTLEGDNSELVTSFIPETGVFCKGMTFVSLVPNSEIKGVTYYHYAIYPQGHMPGVFLSEPVEEGSCIIPAHDCFLDDIISPIPDKETAEEIIARASSIVAQIETALKEVRFYACSLKNIREQVQNKYSEISSLVQEVKSYYNFLQDKQKEITNAVSSFKTEINAYGATVKQQINLLIAQKSDELSQIIQDEQSALNDLWNKIEERLQGIDQVSSLITALRELQEQHRVDIENLKNLISEIPQEFSVTHIEPEEQNFDALADEAIIACITEIGGNPEDLEDSIFVDTLSDQTISGRKTFTASPLVPTPANDSDENIPATTEWVVDKLADIQEDGDSPLSTSDIDTIFS